MKKIYITICIMLLSVYAFSQWTTLTSGTTANLKSIDNRFYGVIAVGANGTIILSTNYGATWSTMPSGISDEINCVHNTGTSYFCAVGNNGRILFGGNLNWVVKASGLTQHLRSVFFNYFVEGTSLQGTGFIVSDWNGGADYIVHKITITNGNWGITQIYQGVIVNFNSIYFTDQNNGFAVGNSGKIIKTTNAGTNWSILTSGTTNNLNSVVFTDINNGYAVGFNGTILKTTNAGTNWSSQSIASSQFYSVCFTDANTGYVVGSSGSIFKTTNAGIGWDSQASGTSNTLNSVCFTDANTGYAVGFNGTILKCVNNVSISEKKSKKLTIYPNPATVRLTIENPDDIEKEIVVKIYNMQGENIISGTYYNQGSMDLDVSVLAEGVYIVKVLTNKEDWIKKLVIQ